MFFVLEPDFAIPVKIGGKELKMRNDAYGNGHYGARRLFNRPHSGIDVDVPDGMPILASKSGFAVCQDRPKGYGKLVIIYHLDNFQTRYSHLSGFNIRKYQWVSQGHVIGFAGRTGNADQAGMRTHLHFEIRKCNETLNPMNYLK